MQHPEFEEGIIAQFKSGQSTALTYVFNLHSKALCYFADRLVANKQEAEDIVTDTFIKLWQRRENFNHLMGIKAFLYIAVRNACFDFLKFNRKRTNVGKEMLYLYDDADLFQDEVVRRQAEAELLQSITKEVEELPKKCRAIFKMIYYDGLNTATISERMGISKQNVLNQKTRALQLLRVAVFGKVIIIVCRVV